MIIAEEVKLVSAIIPSDLQTARAGDWVSLKNFEHVSIILFKGAGLAGEDPTITVEQATAVAGTSAKALAVEKVWQNLPINPVVLTGQDQLSRVALASIPRSSGDTSTILDLTSAENEWLVVIEIDASELDVTNGFDCIRVSTSDVGTTAQLGCALYLLSNPRYNSGSVNTPAITD